jgi:iron complex outermembrane receptor protein
MAVATTAHAQTAAPPAAAAAPEEATLGEIVVTARRKSESLQEVPQTVNAVTAETLQKLRVLKFEDVQTVVPGLSLTSASNGYTFAASLRGVTFSVLTSAQPTVALYMNDAPVQAGFLFQSLFDVGQIEVLKGPQGTTRGVSAPSGAITITTHKPDLGEFGGYIDTTLTDLQGRNVQGAINVPIVKDVLAARIAGVLDQNEYDFVTSIHTPTRPQSTTSAVRASVSFEPNDLFNANVSYQHLDREILSYEQVSGPGQGPFTIGSESFSAAVNPPISPDELLSVQDLPSRSRVHFDVVTAQFDTRIFGQHLSYVGSYQHQKINDESFFGGAGGGDAGNLLPGHELLPQHTLTQQTQTTQEIRLASDPAPGRFIDYTVGAYYNWQHAPGTINNPGPLLPGAFGTSGAVDLNAFNPNYQIPIIINLDSALQETSLFGSVTLHLGANTELSGGIRHIWSITNNGTNVVLGTGRVNLGGVPCSAVGLPAGPNAGDCLIPGGRSVANNTFRTSETPNIYNVSLSHHFTRDFLVYVNTGTAYRPPVSSIGITGDLASSTIPDLQELNFHPSERSRAYEIGFKSTWLDGRARLNASIFRQRFSNLTIYIPGITYLQTANVPASATNFSFTTSVDALVQGFDIDGAIQITPEWNLSIQGSYADGKVQGSLVPCNLTGANGEPIYNTGGLISLCPGGSTSQLPLWNATLQSEYVHPVRDNVDGFIRALFTYYPENKRVEPDFTVDSYGLLSLYAGARSHDGAWEVSVFARNALQAKRATDIQQVQESLNTSLGQSFSQLIRPSGYYSTTFTPPREVGVNVHYAWGSR